MPFGTATLDFGQPNTADGTDASLPVGGQVGLVLATTHIEAWVQAGDSTVDNDATQHLECGAMLEFACSIQNTTTFVIRAMTKGGLMFGTIKCHWSWTN